MTPKLTVEASARIDRITAVSIAILLYLSVGNVSELVDAQPYNLANAQEDGSAQPD